MEALASIFEWLREQEAGFSAVAAILVIVGVVFAGFRWLLSRRGEASADHTPAQSAEAPSATASSADLDPLTVPGFEGRPAIAVLPFDNLSGDPEQEYFADGIAEDLITRLSSWRRFPVIARNSSFTYKGKPVDVKQVSRELGVRYVVEGSVRKTVERIRISAQLIDATSGAHVWAETYDRELQDIFAVQDEITAAIVASIQPELVHFERERAVRKEPQKLDAWDWANRGSWHLDKLTREDNEKGRAFLAKAIEIDPTLAYPVAYLALANVSAAGFGWTDSREHSIQEANRLARKSLELDQREWLAHVALAYAMYLAGQQQPMIAALERAIELNPNGAAAHGHFGLLLALTRRADEAIAALERAIRLSPKDRLMFLWLTAMGHAHFAEGRYKEAASWLERSLRNSPDYQITYRGLAATYAHLNRTEEARMALEEALRLKPNDSISEIKEGYGVTDPGVLERYIDALRRVGLPE
jgi:TolB-like protein/Flp pilus assembly protein TadD